MIATAIMVNAYSKVQDGRIEYPSLRRDVGRA